MQRFVVVASSVSPTIDQRALGLLSDPAPAVLPFDPHQHDHWCSSTGRVHVASWSAHETVSPTDRAVEGGIAALGGLPIVTQPSDAAAFLRPADVTRQLSSLEALTRRLDGPYALVALGPDGTGTAVNDPFGLHPLYVGEFGPSKVLGDDAALVAAVLEALSGCCSEPDEDVVAWLLLNGQMFGDATPYRGVRRLPFGSGAALRSDGEMTVVPWHEPPWSPTAAPAGAFDEAVDLAEQRMIATVRAAVAEAPGAVVSELTAGRDSRLVLELVARAGVADQVLFRTYGPRNSPDRMVAAEIAGHLGVRYDTGGWPSFPGPPTLDTLVAQVRRVSAQISCWESCVPGRHDGITLSGLTGEGLRTNFPRAVGVTTVAGAEEAFRRHRFGRYHYVHEGVLDALQRRSRQLFLEPLDSGAAPHDLFDIFYVQHRLRRWIGDKPDRFVQYVFPLYSPVAVAIAMAGGSEARATAAVHTEIAQRAGLPIADVSVEQGKRWRDRTRDDAPVAPQSAGGEGPTPWTRGQLDGMRSQAIRDAVEFDPGSRAFDMVDRDAMLADAQRYGELDRRQQIELNHAVTVVLWLGLARPGRETVTA